VAGLGRYPCSRLLQAATRITHQPSHTETRAHDKCGDTTEESQASDDGCINVQNILSIED